MSGGAKVAKKAVGKIVSEMKQEVKQQIKKVSKKIERVQKGQIGRIPRVIGDPYLQASVHQAINSYFYPNLGIHRGQAKAFSQSALALLKGSIISSNAVAGSNVFAFLFQPAICNANGWMSYGYGATVAAAVVANSVGSVIGSAQAESFRVVSAQLTLTPQGSFTNQAGSGLTSYLPDTLNFAYSTSNLSNLSLNRPFKGVDTQIVHWLPSENSGLDETEFYSVAGVAASSSAIVGYINIPIASDQVTTWQIDYQLGIEYIPSPGFRPFVEKMSPVQDIRANGHVALYAEKHADPLMIGDLQTYQQYLACALAADGARNGFEEMTHLGSAGTYGTTLTRDRAAAAASAPPGTGKLGHLFRGEVLDVGKHLFQDVINEGLGVYNAIMPGQIFDAPYMDAVD